MKKQIILLAILSCLSLSINGCVLSKAAYNNTSLDAYVSEIVHAQANEDEIIVQYVTVPLDDKDLPSNKQRKSKRCGLLSLRSTMKWREHQSKGFEDSWVVKNRNVSSLLGNDVRIRYDGTIGTTQCSSKSLNNSHRVPVIISLEMPSKVIDREFVYVDRQRSFDPDFYYLHPSLTTNEVKAIEFSFSDINYTPWYGPLLGISILPAMLIDVVAFPIELIYLSITGEPIM